MRKVLFVVLLLWSQYLFSQGQFRISGTIDGLGSTVMHLRYKNDKNTLIQDSITVHNGSFNYVGNINSISLIQINPNLPQLMRSYQPSKSELKELGLSEKDQVYIYIPSIAADLQCIASPGADIKFSGTITDFVAAYPSGNTANNDLADINRRIYPMADKSAALEFRLATEKITDPAKIRSIQDTVENIGKQIVSLEKDFIRNKPSSAVSAWLLEQLMIRSKVSNDEAIALFSILNQTRLKDNPFYAKVVQRIDGIHTTAPGKPAPEISSIHTYDGKRTSLKSMKGNYIILDFWGTWCQPCVSGMPKMKEYLIKYKGKLDIIGIATESDNGERWKKFLDTHKEFNWHQILNQKDNDYVAKYNVEGFPTKIIVDPDGKVVGRFVGEGEKFYKKLDALLR